MSGVDERIRQELQRLTRPVDSAPVLDQVGSRRGRRRVVRRVQVAALALFVVTGTVAGVYGLTRLIGPADQRIPIGESPAPGPSMAPPSDTPDPPGTTHLCDASATGGDLDGDDQQDLVIVYSPVEDPMDIECQSDQVGHRYEVRVTFHFNDGSGGFVAEPQPLPECEFESQCQVFAAPDIDGDGANEVAIRLLFGVSTEYFSLYRLDPEWNLGDPVLERLEIAPPGDPWHEEFGSPAGPGLFAWGGSVTHLHSARCAAESGIPWIVVTATRPRIRQDVYDVHESQFLLEGNQLVLSAASDYPNTPLDELDQVLGSGEDLCGAPVA